MDPNEKEEIARDFQCHYCGAIFTTEYDRRQHLEKHRESDMRKPAHMTNVDTNTE